MNIIPGLVFEVVGVLLYLAFVVYTVLIVCTMDTQHEKQEMDNITKYLLAHGKIWMVLAPLIIAMILLKSMW